ncbi:hypothetical protein THRCLA_20673 [Thraustotheca clavata]|uniref:Transmembrane protein n=1 Tax=Thraustotheca clavata TaxID=74557 RepID=A0A1W0A4Z1_9STRA|nr:hypothetical protein THRCLA_20673 [Thraustotheca clavata]
MIWTESNDTIYIGFLNATTTRAWLTFKLAYRCCFCIYIMAYMWRQYYQHYYHLAANLRAFGFEKVTRTDRIDIVVGDPTSIILLNPYVSIVFILDVWVSIEFINRAIVRVNQVSDIGLFSVACFYLSRTLWFAYGGLIGVSYLLKKFHKEKSFEEADPTLTAMAVVIAAGPITNVQSHIMFFIDLYHYLFLALSKDENSNEVALSAIVYTFIIGSLPINFGFISKHFTWIQKYRTSRTASYGSFMMNDIKHRLTHCFNLMTLSDSAVIVEGGSIYQLFELDRKFKRNLGMSQRGADCYLLFGTGNQRTSVRLTLLSCIDPSHHIPTIINKTAAVGRLYFKNNEVRLVHGTYDSPWVA